MLSDPERIGVMQEMIDSTWRMKRTRDRSDDLPTGVRVLNVLRVENHGVFGSYFQHKAEVKERRLREGHLQHFPVATDGCMHRELDREINEMYLFHGTNPDAANSIANGDFDMSRVGSAVGTMFGPGIYLAENASKSDEYAKEGSGIFIGQRALLVCRAVAGKVFTTPEKGDQSGHVTSGEHDCVCGDRLAAVGTFREMIFFDSGAVYTEFVIIYTRRFDTPAPDTAAVSAAASLLADAPPSSIAHAGGTQEGQVCTKGCGRPVALPEKGRVFRTCCRMCALGGGHGHTPDCDARASAMLPGCVGREGESEEE